MRDSERLDEIKERSEFVRTSPLGPEAVFKDLIHLIVEDVPFLLAEIERLERERDELLERMG